ncbi:Phosphoadenosine phosphosulfate reductase family protein [Kaistia soli DSM 19436]|uniref:Phosphoadenosine phosphosulfate reductase family protein n=1 Tax=Kaistia soli DSM 19436 TaxID=1122133 RepID=A0A1M4VE14_9HYPH|nr:phosphoadenosine phosphosulfate reductase family protein [Kaistia soli]SHE67229.1 Phosphoadenosine phosphosulfate reductase family protein [Kaistia soli DSM 19436]
MREILDYHPAPLFRADSRTRRDRNSPKPYEHVVSISGGKDSTAVYLLAIERGMPFTAVFADTGNEHPATYEFVERLAERAGGPPIVTVKADFSKAMARKRAFILRNWERMGVSPERVERAAALMLPTGNPFLDLCMVKGRFPSAKSRFCTDETKLVPMWIGVERPILADGRTLIRWLGVRGEESLARRDLPGWQRMGDPVPYSLPKPHHAEASEQGWRTYVYRPIHHWVREDVFAMHARHGITPNPLYGWGAERVGCWPCIFVKKEELRLIAGIDPSAIDRLDEWESIVSDVSKRGVSTFFAAVDDPLFTPGVIVTTAGFGIRSFVEWSKTSRGGRQYDLMARFEAGASCVEIGVCE